MTNFEAQTNRIKQRGDTLRAELAALDAHLAAAVTRTAELLDVASSIGVSVVSIGKRHPLVENENWPFGVEGSIFTPPKERTADGWPAAWHIAKRAGVSAGAGNTGQHQADTSNLVDGVYQCKSGQWVRVDLDLDEVAS